MNPPRALSWAVIPVHNRRELSLRCLRWLKTSGAMDIVRVIVVDDGSTDGTAELVAKEFPEVTLLRGDGNLWWTGAIVRGMKHALTNGAQHVFWLNDDTLPESGALEKLRAASGQNAIAGGACFLPGEAVPAYGGMRKTRTGLRPIEDRGNDTVPADALHGNMVCIARRVIEDIGWPDEIGLPHALADLDYTMRARERGVPVLFVGSARARGEPNVSVNYRSWLLSDVPLSTWWRELRRHGSHLNWRAQFRFHWRHWRGPAALGGPLLVGRLAVISVVRGLVPLRWLRKWRGHRSRAWKHEQRHRARL